MKRVLCAAFLTTLPLAAINVAPAQAAQPSYYLTIKEVTTTSVRVSATCPNDPPDFISVSFPKDQSLGGGGKHITCTGKKQKFTVSLTKKLKAGTKVYMRVSINGDGGEINAWGTFKVARPED